MFFRNLTAYYMPDHSAFLQADMLEQALAQRAFQPCGATQPVSLGWVPALGGDTTALVHAEQQRFLIRLKREERILPPAVVRELVSEKVAAIEEEQGRKVYRKERLALQDEIVLDALPRAFTKSACMWAYIDVKAGWIFVDSASSARCEELLNALRECVGSMPVLIPQVVQSPRAAMTGWLAHQNLPDWLWAGEVCVLEEEGGTVRARGVDLYGEEVETHLNSGRQVSRLELGTDSMAFTLGDDLRLRGLRFADEVKDQNDGLDHEVDRASADFFLMTELIGKTWPRLLEAFGGHET
jgi:recombination associated protein RdgC